MQLQLVILRNLKCNFAKAEPDDVKATEKMARKSPKVIPAKFPPPKKPLPGAPAKDRNTGPGTVSLSGTDWDDVVHGAYVFGELWRPSCLHYPPAFRRCLFPFCA